MKFEKSKLKNKKYSVITPKGKKINFGDKRFQQFKDSTGLGLYSDLDHNDKKRKKNYCKRSGNIKDKKGDFTLLRFIRRDVVSTKIKRNACRNEAKIRQK